MERIRTWYKNLVFRKKIFLNHLAISLIPVIILGTFCYGQTRNLLIQREKEVLKGTLEQSVLSLDSSINLYNHVLDNIVWDTNIRGALEKRYQNNQEMYLVYRDVIDPTISRIRNLYPWIKRLLIYSENPTLNPHGDILRKMEEAEPFPDGLSDNRIHWKADTDGELKLWCQFYSKESEERNVAYMTLDYPSFFGSLSGLFDDHYGVMIVNGSSMPVYFYTREDGVAYSYDEVRQSPDGSAPSGPLEPEEILAGSSRLKDYVMEEQQIPSNGWRVFLYRPLRTVSSSAMSITILIGGTIVICLLLILGTGLTLSGSIVRPLDQLMKNIDQMEQGNLTVFVKEDSLDEIGQLIRSFSHMVDRLNEMIQEVYVSKIAQQEQEMKALQAQINPHFLYNSLSLINWRAIMADQPEISEMAQLLSTFYRTTLNKGKNLTTVKGEWDNTCSYARIQHLMHSGKFDLDLRIEEPMKDYEILNLLLQPLVENAIMHGLDHKEGDERKKLWVIGREKEDILEFEVRDNGCGMTQEEAERILSVKSQGYGMQNVNQRIHLYYGEEYGLSITSEKGVGTSVFLRIPKRKGEKPAE